MMQGLGKMFFRPLVLAAPLMMIFGMGMNASAQPLANVEVSPAPQGTDPHPTVYNWEGEIKPVREPGVGYYYFFYTGSVGADATVPLGVDIKRIAIPYREWESNKRAMVGRLTTHFEEAFGAIEPSSSTPEVEFDANFNYVTVEAEEEFTGSGVDPRAAAEWTFYLDQVILWQFYCRRVLIGDMNASQANSDRSTLQRVSDRDSLAAAFPGINPDELLAEQDRLREEQGIEEFGVEEGSVGTAAEDYDAMLIYEDPGVLNKFVDEFVLLAEEREELATEIYSSMLTRIEERRSEQQLFEDWQERKKVALVDFAKAWGKVHSGQRVRFENTFYLITDAPLASVPADALNIVIGEVLTPQDLIGRDGRLKTAESERRRTTIDLPRTDEPQPR